MLATTKELRQSLVSSMKPSLDWECQPPSSQTTVLNSHPTFLKANLKPLTSLGIFIFCIMPSLQGR